MRLTCAKGQGHSRVYDERYENIWKIHEDDKEALKACIKKEIIHSASGVARNGNSSDVKL